MSRPPRSILRKAGRDAGRSNAASTGRATARPPRRWRARGCRRAPSITIARASMPASSASPARRARTRQAMSRPRIRPCARSWVPSPTWLERRWMRASSASTAARSRPRPRPSPWSRRASPASGRARGSARSAPGAAARIRAAAAAHPFMVAGTGRFCTEVMTDLRRPGVRQDWRRGRLLRGLSGARLRRRLEMRRRRDARGRADDGGRDRAAAAACRIARRPGAAPLPRAAARQLERHPDRVAAPGPPSSRATSPEQASTKRAARRLTLR